jgi:two-component system NtrC family sensor kinase
MSPPKTLASVSRERPAPEEDDRNIPHPPGQAPFPLALLELQARFIRGGAAQPLLNELLSLALQHTRSEYGFLGELHLAPDFTVRFQLLASTPPGWTEALEAPLGHQSSRTPRPGGLNELVHRALTTGRPTVSEDPSLLGGEPLPPGGSPLNSFLALPLDAGEERVGVVGLANRPGGYEAELLSALQPLATVAGSLLHGKHLERRHRDTEEFLRQTQATVEHLRLALASVEDGLWDWHIPSRELRPSRRFLELLGYGEGELPPTLNAWKQLCHPEDLKELKKLMREHSEGTRPLVEFAYRARRKEGDWAWVLSRAKVVARDEQGRPVRMIGTDFDITARKRTEERLAALIQAIPDLIFRLRGDGTFIDFNSGAPEPTALSPPAFLGKRIQDLPLPRTFVELTVQNVERVLREGSMAVYEYDMVKDMGMQRYEARVVRSGQNEVVCIVRNITDRKLAEDRQAHLIQAEKLALLGQLAAGVAHEINNPVSYVTSNLSSLGRYVTELSPLLRSQRDLIEALGAGGRAPPMELLTRARELWARQDTDFLLQDMTDIVKESLEGSRRIKEIAQSLRTFARSEVEGPQRVNLNDELESTLRMVWNELKYKCEVKRDFGELPLVACYPTQITQVFTNLLVNAAQAIVTMGEIRIQTRHEGSYVVVRISDTGTGMTAETLAKLSTPFFTTKPRGQGTGLGLYISYGIISRHKGRIDVESELGKGTTFTLHLPLTQDDTSPRPPD